MSSSVAVNPIKKWIYFISSRPPRWIIQFMNAIIARNSVNQPFHPIEDFPWAGRMEKLYPDVRREMESLLQHIENMPTVHEILPNTHYYYSHRDWRQVAFFTYGVKVEDHCALYPKTWEAFQQVPGLVAGTVSILSPGENLPAHKHIYKGLLLFHMGVIIPRDGGGCAIINGNQTRSWQEGEVWIMDPTYTHEVWNKTEHYRLILMGEFRHPGMPALFRYAESVFVWGFRTSPIGKHFIKKIQNLAARHRREVEASQAKVALAN